MSENRGWALSELEAMTETQLLSWLTVFNAMEKRRSAALKRRQGRIGKGRGRRLDI